MNISLENIESAVVGAGSVILLANAFVAGNRMAHDKYESRDVIDAAKHYSRYFIQLRTNLIMALGFEEKRK